MQAGKLRHKLTFSHVTFANNKGAATQSITQYATVWGSLNPVNGTEIIKGAQQKAQTNYEIRCRWFDGVEPTDEISFEGRTLSVVSVLNPDERKKELVITCRE